MPGFWECDICKTMVKIDDTHHVKFPIMTMPSIWGLCSQCLTGLTNQQFLYLAEVKAKGEKQDG